MREGSACAVLADELQLSQQAEPCVVVEPSSLAVLSSSAPALLRVALCSLGRSCAKSLFVARSFLVYITSSLRSRLLGDAA